MFVLYDTRCASKYIYLFVNVWHSCSVSIHYDITYTILYIACASTNSGCLHSSFWIATNSLIIVIKCTFFKCTPSQMKLKNWKNGTTNCTKNKMLIIINKCLCHIKKLQHVFHILVWLNTVLVLYLIIGLENSFCTFEVFTHLHTHWWLHSFSWSSPVFCTHMGLGFFVIF